MARREECGKNFALRILHSPDRELNEYVTVRQTLGQSKNLQRCQKVSKEYNALEYGVEDAIEVPEGLVLSGVHQFGVCQGCFCCVGALCRPKHSATATSEQGCWNKGVVPTAPRQPLGQVWNTRRLTSAHLGRSDAIRYSI
eukprot:scaffold1558_cov403-Prasinococcus_capsulatus_cf.AAC.43